MAWLLAILGLVAASLAIGQPFPANAPEVVIPNFWDPTMRADRDDVEPFDGIRFVTSDNFPPFNFTNADGRLIGFHIDLARAICEELEVPCTMQVRPFEDLVETLTTDRADAAIAGIAISAGTQREINFSDVYLRLPARFVVRRGLPLEISASALAGQRIAVVAGTAHQAYLETFFASSEAVLFENAEAARSALRSGEAEILFGDGLQLSFWLQGLTAGECCMFAGGPYLEAAFFGPGMAIAVAPEQAAILAGINEALRSIYTDGTYAGIYLRYFPVSFY